MFTLRIENDLGKEITLTQNESNYQVINIDGLNPPKASIYTSTIPNMDGTKYKSSRVEMRNIVIMVRINGDVESNRQTLYRYFRSGKKCRVHYTNDNRDVFIEGYCESVVCGIFTNNEVAQISIVCPQPYFKSAELIITDISQVIGAFEFPFAINVNGIEFSYINSDEVITIRNDGDLESGLIVNLVAEATVQNPVVYNHETGEFFKLNYTMNEGDRIRINTNKGSKSVYLNDTGNIMQYRDASSTWLSLELGNNLFSYSADTNAEHLRVTFEFNRLYEGV